MKAYSEDLRQRVLAVLDSVMSRADAVTTFRVSLSSLKRWCAQRTALGRLRLQLDATPDATLPEHLDTWSREQGRPLSRWTMSRSIKRLRFSRKKLGRQS